MKITEEQVRYVADLANLELTPEETHRMARDLDEILTHIDKLNELDTTGVEPMAQVLYDAGGDRDAARDDEPRPTLGSETALANAPALRRRLFQGSQGDRTMTPPETAALGDRRHPATASTPNDSAPRNWRAQRSALRRSGESQDQRLSRTSARSAPWPRPARVDEKLARGEDPGPLAGVPGRRQGRHPHQGRAHHLRLAGCSPITFRPTTPPPSIRLEAGRRRDPRQDQLRRVRHGLVQRELGLRAGAQSGGARTACRADRAAGRPRWWRRARRWCRWAPTPAAPSASRRRSAAWSASRRPTAAFRATV